MRFLWLIIPALAVGCDSAAGPGPSDLAVSHPDLGAPFQLHVGERAIFTAIGLDFRFREVTSDSRCPSNALILCVWEGDATVVIETAPIATAARYYELHTALDPKSVVIGAVRITLELLDPYPKDVTPIPSDAYVATFVVESVE